MVSSTPEETENTFAQSRFAKTMSYINLDEQIEQAKKDMKSSDAQTRRLAGLKLMDLYNWKYGEN